MYADTIAALRASCVAACAAHADAERQKRWARKMLIEMRRRDGYLLAANSMPPHLSQAVRARVLALVAGWRMNAWAALANGDFGTLGDARRNAARCWREFLRMRATQ